MPIQSFHHETHRYNGGHLRLFSMIITCLVCLKSCLCGMDGVKSLLFGVNVGVVRVLNPSLFLIYNNDTQLSCVFE